MFTKTNYLFYTNYPFAGENGSGKTTILSFIAKIFRYIQRFRDRIPCDFSLAYTIETDGKEHSIILEK